MERAQRTEEDGRKPWGESRGEAPGGVLEFIKMSGSEDDAGDLPSTGGSKTSGQMAVKRPDREGGIGAPGMLSVRDHG